MGVEEKRRDEDMIVAQTAKLSLNAKDGKNGKRPKFAPKDYFLEMQAD